MVLNIEGYLNMKRQEVRLDFYGTDSDGNSVFNMGSFEKVDGSYHLRTAIEDSEPINLNDLFKGFEDLSVDHKATSKLWSSIIEGWEISRGFRVDPRQSYKLIKSKSFDYKIEILDLIDSNTLENLKTSIGERLKLEEVLLVCHLDGMGTIMSFECFVDDSVALELVIEPID
jgi:hypothetical protein